MKVAATAFLFFLSIFCLAISANANRADNSYRLTGTQWRRLDALPIPVVLMPVPKGFRVDDLSTLYDDGSGVYGYELTYRDGKGDRLWISGMSRHDSTNPMFWSTSNDINVRLSRNPQPLRFRSNVFGQVAVARSTGGVWWRGLDSHLPQHCISTTLLHFKQNRFVIGYCGYSDMSGLQLADWIRRAAAFSLGAPRSSMHGFSGRQWEALSALDLPVILPRSLPEGFHVAHVWATFVPEGASEGHYNVTYSNGRSSFDFETDPGGHGGADVPATAFAARYDSGILGSGAVTYKGPGCYGSPPMTYLKTEYNYVIYSCHKMTAS